MPSMVWYGMVHLNIKKINVGLLLNKSQRSKYKYYNVAMIIINIQENKNIFS